MVNLLETHALLSVLAAPDRLSQSAREAVAAGNSALSVSSYWKVVINTRKGLLPIPDPVSWWTLLAELPVGRVLPIWARHITTLAALPDLHRDPFDWIAKAIAEGWPLITRDRQLAYPVRVVR